MSNMPLVSESINVRVLLRVLLGFRFGRWQYYREYAKLSDARVVVVWHDTMREAYFLKKHLEIPIYCVQNGIRSDLRPPLGKSFIQELRDARENRPSVDKYFALDLATKSRLENLIEATFVISGSYRLNDFVGMAPSESKQNQPKRRIGLIASFPNFKHVPGGRIELNDSTFFYVGDVAVSYSQFFAIDARLAKVLANIADENDWDFAVIGKRPAVDPVERDFFGGIQEVPRIRVIPHDKGHGYEVAQEFDLLVCIDSTLGYEMLAYGSKVGFVSNRFRLLGMETNELSFAYPLDTPSDGPFWTSATSESDIREFLTNLFALTDSEWADARTKYASVIMNLDPGNQMLRTAIRDTIKTPQ